MKPFTLEQVASATHGAYHGNPALLQTMVRGVVIDNRHVERDFLFTAIVGERLDGHRFIQSAYEAGAICCVTEQPLDTDKPYILVDSTLRAFQDIAAFYKSLFDVKTVGITGSAGKTTTKEMIAGVLSKKYDVLWSEGNLNNQTGVPLTLLRLEDHHQIAVVEMGTNHFGEIRALARIVKPDYCFLTNIGTAHIEYLGSREGILKAKCEMLEHMAEGGTVFLNGDDGLLRTMANSGKKTVFYGCGENNGVRAENIDAHGLSGTAFTACHPQGKTEVFVPSPGRHMVLNALAAFAAGLAFEIDPEKIAEAIADYVPVGDRMRVSEANGVTVLCDVYNANPDSMRAALDTLALSGGRKVCILGDMRELGEQAEALHRGIGAYAAQKADLVLCVGDLAQYIREEAGKNALWFGTQEELIPRLPELIQKGDTVLVKASRGMKLEQTAEVLLDAKGGAK